MINSDNIYNTLSQFQTSQTRAVGICLYTIICSVHTNLLNSRNGFQLCFVTTIVCMSQLGSFLQYQDVIYFSIYVFFFLLNKFLQKLQSVIINKTLQYLYVTLMSLTVINKTLNSHQKILNFHFDVAVKYMNHFEHQRKVHCASRACLKYLKVKNP